jgi:hypothetical protein
MISSNSASTSPLRHRMAALLQSRFELAMEEHRTATEWALAETPSGLPSPDGLVQTQQLWREVGRTIAASAQTLAQYSKLVNARTVDDLIEWATMMGWECQTEADIVKRVELALEEGEGKSQSAGVA